MSDSPSKREKMRTHVADARSHLAEIAAAYSEADLAALQVTPEWNGLEMLRHILFWNDTVLQSLADWAGSRRIESDTLDGLNQQEVLARAGLGREALIAQLSAAYDTYEAILLNGSDAELSEPGVTAWGEHTTRLGLIGVVGHDEEHYEEIRLAAAR